MPALTNSQTSQGGKHVQNVYGSGGIRTHASEETGALNQRLRPLGHATSHIRMGKKAALTYQMMKLCWPGPMGNL